MGEAGYAIIQMGSKQFRVAEGNEIVVDRLPDAPGSFVELVPLLVVGSKAGEIQVGTPLVGNVKVKAKILEHILGDKIHVFTFKAKVRYRRKKGFRAQLTRLKIEQIGLEKKAKAKPIKRTKTKPRKKAA